VLGAAEETRRGVVVQEVKVVVVQVVGLVPMEHRELLIPVAVAAALGVKIIHLAAADPVL